MEQTKSAILPGLIKGLPDGYFGHGLPPAHRRRGILAAIAFKEV
jgi:hypothetical protein